jgi:hypothetical protein
VVPPSTEKLKGRTRSRKHGDRISSERRHSTAVLILTSGFRRFQSRLFACIIRNDLRQYAFASSSALQPEMALVRFAASSWSRAETSVIVYESSASVRFRVALGSYTWSRHGVGFRSGHDYLRTDRRTARFLYAHVAGSLFSLTPCATMIQANSRGSAVRHQRHRSE